jgi:hypothetical protein
MFGVLRFKMTHLIGLGWIEVYVSFSKNVELQSGEIFSGLFAFHKML